MDKNKVLNKKSLLDLFKAVSELDKKRILLSGLYSSAKSFAISGVVIKNKGVHLILLNNRDDASFCADDLNTLLGEDKVFFLPPSKEGRREDSKDSSFKVQRTAALKAINDYKRGDREDAVLVSYPDSLKEAVLKDKDLNKSYFTIKKGDNLSHQFIKDLLISFSFDKVDFISEPGEFAVRGSIIDIFSYADNKPYRLEFFGDEVEDIKIFNTSTQRSVEPVKSMEICPNLFDTAAELERESIFEFFPEDTIIWISDPDELRKRDEPEVLDIYGEIDKFKSIHLSQPLKGDIVYHEEIRFNTSPQPLFRKNFDILAEDIRNRVNDGYQVFIMSENEKQIDRLRSIFESYELKPEFVNFTIHEGFVENDSKMCIFTDHQIFERYRRVRLTRSVDKSERLTINDLNSFRIGDYVVHIDHGVGKFGGLVKINTGGKEQEAVKLVYRDNDVLFVSIHGLHRISKYKSKDSTPPKIYKLGTGAWQKLKSQTKSKVKEIAIDLAKLYAERRAAKGFAFSPDSYLQQELESSFMYEDTPDQYRANIAIKEDMERAYPMDRLICGDVGFGKTELAIRAAFKAVTDSKQVAVLVPTTILALQHYNTFRSRLEKFPCSIEFLSRLKSTKEANEIIERVAAGKIDIIIGTHRLLNKKIVFKDLGLLVVDEEQKFGVAAKERLRELKLAVDTLTMTATPIPRTLQFSLLGARDMSIINTPPANRLPIQTEIIDFDETTLREVINYELERDGQIFFVHNRVEDILSVEDIIRRVVPGIRTVVAHGQMDAHQLERRVMEFIDGDYDLLLSTTIIENGIDIPNANTIIINQAQNFGLSDLHQLRGRVGRSNRKAFCYLIVPPMLTLSDDARRRLRAIETFSDLGSGFNIAMQDLDIRGMGNLLGGEQSGFVAEMGFETYQKILAEVFTEITAGEYPEEEGKREDISYPEVQYITDCVIDTDMDIRIPDDYLSITSEKIRLYKELDAISDQESLRRFKEEMVDRFGPIPEPLEQLMYVVSLRRAAVKCGFERIVLKESKMLAYFISDKESLYYKSEIFIKIISNIQSGRRFRVKENNNRLRLEVLNVKTVEEGYDILKSFF